MSTPEAAGAWLRQVLPSGTRAVVADLSDDPTDDDLWPTERDAITSAVEVRRREFAAGRRCARLAVDELGHQPAAIPVGPNREPVWPADLIGSITHTRHLVGAAVADGGVCRSLGIDFEVAGRVDDSLVDRLLTENERERLGAPSDTLVPTVIFSAKEAIYKATFPLTRCWLGFEDVEVSLDLAAGTFEADVLPSVDHPMAGERLQGFHRSMLGHVLTAIAI